MTWTGRNLPRNWTTIRARVIRRDGHHCTWCRSTQNLEVDHIGDPDDHHTSNLRTLCHSCHEKRTQAQAKAAARRAWKERQRLRYRPKPPHPGTITTGPTAPLPPPVGRTPLSRHVPQPRPVDDVDVRPVDLDPTEPHPRKGVVEPLPEPHPRRVGRPRGPAVRVIDPRPADPPPGVENHVVQHPLLD